MKYKPYPKYKDSSIEWLGEIPEHWEVKRLKYVCRVNPSKSEISHLNKKTEITFLPMECIGESGELDLSQTKRISEVINGYSYLCEDDVIIAKITPCFENGKGAIAKGLLNQIAFATTEVITLRPYIKESNRFIYYLLFCPPFRKYAEGSMYGAGGQKRVSDNFVANYHFSTPPLDEQKTIADFLDKETAKIDQLISLQEKLIALLQEKRQALMHNAIANENCKYIRLGYIADSINRKVDRIHDELYIPIGMFNRGRGFFKKEETFGKDLGDSEFNWIKAGDLVFSGQFAWEGAIGLTSENEEECIASHRYPIIRGKENIANTAYLFAFFSTKHGDFLLDEHSRGSAGRNRPLNINTLLKEKIPLPSMEIQWEIAKFIEFEKILKEKIKKPIRLLEEKRQALISAAVTGKIDVRGFPPDPRETGSERY